MRYSYSRDQLDAPADNFRSRLLARSRARPRVPETVRVEEPTMGQILRFADGEAESVTLADRYVLRRVLGVGGMATVFQAHDRVLDREVAVKVLTGLDPRDVDTRARFLSEARLTACLRHPNIVEVLDFRTTTTGVVYLTMELLRGETLHARLTRETYLDWAEARALMLDICAGLEAVHAAGIVHRDLKPSNCACVCLRADGRGREQVRLLDFGIAKRVDGSSKHACIDEVVGTPEYMAPEQIRGGPVDQRADIYAAGLILGELLTGALPYDATTPAALMIAHLYEPVARLSDLAPRGVRIPAALDRIYARATSRDPDDRYPDIRSFADALREVDIEAEIDEGSPHESLSAALSSCWTRIRRAQRRSWLGHAVAAGVALALGVGATLSFGYPGEAPTDELAARADANADALVSAPPADDLELPRECAPWVADEPVCDCTTQRDQLAAMASDSTRSSAGTSMGLTNR